MNNGQQKRFWTTGITRASNKKICPHWFEV
jgi:hypothetical protein